MNMRWTTHTTTSVATPRHGEDSKGLLSLQRLDNENHRFKNSGGISQKNHCVGFLPAFCDTRTGSIYQSCFANGRPAPVHVLDGLPAKLVLKRSKRNRIEAVQGSITAGFMLKGQFFTREQAASYWATGRAQNLK